MSTYEPVVNHRLPWDSPTPETMYISSRNRILDSHCKSRDNVTLHLTRFEVGYVHCLDGALRACQCRRTQLAQLTDDRRYDWN
jgi:hypothetical protein